MLRFSELVVPSKSAIVVIDVQNDFCAVDGAAARGGKDVDAVTAMLPRVQRFLANARAHGTNVIFVQTIHEPSTDSEAWIGRRTDPDARTCVKGSWGAAFAAVEPLPHEPVVVKHRYSAFVHTRLDSVLRTMRVENLIVLGVATNVCVESTSRHGYMLDYNVVLVSDCCAGYDAAAHDMTLHNHRTYFGTVATSDAIVASWAATHAVASGA